jgi:6-phosphofructokinase 1
VDEARRVLVASDVQALQAVMSRGGAIPSFEPAGPRAELFFDPARLTCGLVTGGGLCPGVNNVIRSLVLTLHYGYGVPRILGFRYGYAGLSVKSGYDPLPLTPQVVENVHQQGGTLLGSSRGPQDPGDMVDSLVRVGVSLLFAIGGDGTLRGAHAIVDEITRRGLPIAVVGVPKTIDNDLDWIERSFGFATAVEEARKVIVGAHAEARGAWDGVGLVKLMGRQSGFIAAHASLANSDVNFCLVPEVRLSLEGPKGFLSALDRRLNEKHHAVIVVAEGAGQDLLQDPRHVERDPSGNLKLKDIGVFLKDRITQFFADRGRDITIKYIDPSYTIRSLPANSLDSEFCLMLGQHAAHAGLAGKTDMVVGFWNQRFTHVPVPLAVASRKTLDPNGETWQCVLEATGQPAQMG